VCVWLVLLGLSCSQRGVLVWFGLRDSAHTLRSEEFAGYVDGFTSDDNELLALKKLFCDCAG